MRLNCWGPGVSFDTHIVMTRLWHMQSCQLCPLVSQASSQWGIGASDFQCKYPGGFLKRAWAAWDNWKLCTSDDITTLIERLGKHNKIFTDHKVEVNVIIINYLSELIKSIKYLYYLFSFYIEKCRFGMFVKRKVRWLNQKLK